MQFATTSSKASLRRVARADAGMRALAVVAMSTARGAVVVVVVPSRSPGPGRS